MTAVLPDAQIVEPRSDAWFAIRRTGITATDIPKLLGLSTYGNALSVWHDKRGTMPDETSGEAADWGTLLEGVVADEWARRHHTTVAPAGVVRGDPTWTLASPDRYVGACPDTTHYEGCVLEVKTRSAYVAGRWHRDMPDDVLAQVAWQRRVTGADHVHVACLIGGQRLIEHRYDRDDQLEGYLLDVAGPVWEAVVDDTPPEVDANAVLARVLDLLNVDRSGERDIDPDTAARLLARHRAATAAAKAAKTEQDAARAAVLAALGDADTLTSNGERVFTYKPQTRRSVALTGIAKTDPDLYASLADGGHITETTTRVLRAAQRGDTDE